MRQLKVPIPSCLAGHGALPGANDGGRGRGGLPQGPAFTRAGGPQDGGAEAGALRCKKLRCVVIFFVFVFVLIVRKTHKIWVFTCSWDLTFSKRMFDTWFAWSCFFLKSGIFTYVHKNWPCGFPRCKRCPRAQTSRFCEFKGLVSTSVS